MLREFEREILTKINFVDRFINATNEFTRNGQTNYKLNSKDIVDSLKGTTFIFKRKSRQYFTDVDKREYVFRLLFDIKDDSILTYIFVLQGDKFIDNGLSNFGYLLNYFDIDGKVTNQNFGINSRDDFRKYVDKMTFIFDDFVNEFISNNPPT
jgi:hypothetical protein